MVYTYTSTRADYDPAKLFIVCPPSGQAAAAPEAAAFAKASGWKALTEWERWSIWSAMRTELSLQEAAQ